MTSGLEALVVARPFELKWIDSNIIVFYNRSKLTKSAKLLVNSHKFQNFELARKRSRKA